MSKENKKELENQIEAILFASGKGVDPKKLAELCETNEKEVLKSLKNLKLQYEERDSSLQITEHTDKWKLTVKGKYVSKIEKLVSETEMSPTVLKTLAMIAFKSPVLQSEIIDARGQSAYEHVKTLVHEKFVTKEESGRSFILKITDKFYEYFDVEGDEEIRELFSKLKEEHMEKLGELEVVDINENKNVKTETESLEENEKIDEEKAILGLKVVDSEFEGDEHNNIFNDEEKKEQFREQKNFQKQFLTDIDSKIEEISNRIKSHEDIQSINREYEEENNKDNEENNNENDNYNNINNDDDEEEKEKNNREEENDDENNEENDRNKDIEKNKIQNNEGENEDIESLENFVDEKKENETEEENYL